MAQAELHQRYHFFAGKGGVGKTTLAAAHALAQAELGHRVLVLSTDPAHSLGDALTARLGGKPRRIATRRGTLLAAELDADAALKGWLEDRRGALHRIAANGTYLDDEDIERLLNLALPGVDELIGLVELVRLARESEAEVVVVDTAPTGHTLRLLEMPETLRTLARVFDDMQAKHRFVAESLAGRHRADAGDAVIAEIDAEGRWLAELLRDPSRTTFTWVLLPEELALAEAIDGVSALEKSGIAVEAAVVNRLTPPPDGPCALCSGRRRTEAEVLVHAREALGRLVLEGVAAQVREPRGLAALRSIARARGPLPKPRANRGRAPAKPAAKGGGEAAVLLAPPGVRLLLFGGKGGVGKSTGAAAAAVSLAHARPKQKVLLLSTDPAHSLGDVLSCELDDVARTVRGGPDNLHVRELDAARALESKRARYRDAIDALFDALRGGSRLEATFDRQIVQDLLELAPPGLDELFGVLAVIDALFPSPGDAGYDLVVLDTAPTGHTLRLLELPAAALEWVHALLAILLKYRQVLGLGPLAQDLVQLAKELKALRELLADPAQTRFIPVSRPAELPQLETRRLVAALDRLRVPVGPLLINACTPPGCSRCKRSARTEAKLLRPGSFGRKDLVMMLAPALAPPPRGSLALERFARCWRRE